MKTIDIFFQGEGLHEVQYLQIESDATFGIIKAKLVEKYNLPDGVLLFVEDMDKPLDDDMRAADFAGTAGLKLHYSRCAKVEVAVTYNGETVHFHFSPSATVDRIKKWAAESKFKMTDEEAGEHVLQISGTHERPAPSSHIGALALPETCEVKFDLVPDERVNGAPKSEK